VSEKGKNIVASVRQRLANVAQRAGVDFQQVLSSYAIERFLYRLSVSKHGDDFVLKGATLFTLWEGFPHRQTRDVDLLGFGDKNIERLVEVFQEILASPVPEDGLTFSKDVSGEAIRAVQEYGGTRMNLIAHLGNARITVGVDVGFGDKITPPPKRVEFPTLLDFPKPKMRAYPVETVVAEKLQALVSLGIANSRMKDFFDLWHIARKTGFDGLKLSSAIQGTFERRRTPIPIETPVGLSEEFSGNPMKQTQWRAFCRKAVKADQGAELNQVVDLLSDFLLPILRAVGNKTQFKSKWTAGGPWKK
jgi:predicted nucleotidyltransferase component of viral defense system